MKKRSVLRRLQLVALFTGFALFSAQPVTAQIVINEVVASNGNTVADEDGEFPDWIEFYNASDSSVNLSGYGISDDAEDPFKYKLPGIALPSGGYYLLFASDKDREGADIIWETVVRQGDSTKYIIPDASTQNSWIDTEYDDSAWDDGLFGIGYGDGDDATEIVQGKLAVFARNKFTVEDPASVQSIALHVDYDDGYIAYLNGTEIYRVNMNGEAPAAYNESASTYTEPKLIFGEPIEGAFLDEFRDLLVEGENVFAIQMHNSSTTSSDLTLIPFLSLGYSEVPPNAKGAANGLSLSAFPHSNFKLSADGETLFLTNSDSVLIDEMSFPHLKRNESFGRATDNDSIRYIYTQPTPLGANTTAGYLARLPEPEIDIPGGFFEEDIYISLTDTSMGDIVYYTADGSDPTAGSIRFGKEPRRVFAGDGNTFTLKFRTVESGKLSSNVITHTYFMKRSHSLPIVTVTTHPDNLWSDESGIYARGTNGISGNCEGPVNWNQDWEIPIHIELYEQDGSRAFSSGAGAKIFGGCSRQNPAKSLSIFFRGEYGNAALEYKLFEEKELDEFQAFVLRNSGNDFSTQGGTMFRDGLMKTLIEKTDLEYQAFRPAVVYLNGEYWGIHNIREKVNEHFLASNGYADSEEIDLLEGDGWVVHGFREKWDEFLDALGSTDMSDPAEYAEVENMIDVNNYIDYMAAEIYFANTDWPGNNIKYWRNRLTNGKWRWIIYDTDFGFNLSYGGHVGHNTLDFALEPNGPDWPNPSWSTYVFRKMTESPVFVRKFVNRMSGLMNTSFDKEYANKVIDSLSQKIALEMEQHQDRWGGSVAGWEGSVEGLRSFADGRRDYMEDFIQQRFNLTEPVQITVDVNNSEYGEVKVHRTKPETYPWSGSYFGNNKLDISAIPKPGYVFTGWSGTSTSTNNTIEIQPRGSYTANFEPSETQTSNIVINEIMYNDSEEVNPGDWIELYNAADFTIDISGWLVKDEDDTHIFTFPSGTEMESGTFLVVAADLEDFNNYYDEISPLFGELGFGLAGGDDQVRVYDDNGTLIDSLQYNDEDPWPAGPDGTGFTLELKDPNSDNADPLNWATSETAGGTPGAENTVLVASNEGEEGVDIPTRVALLQNYPNPFNPSTNITFELPEQARVRLTVFDMLGRQVAQLEDGIRSAGIHTLTWNASQQASGVYFYRLQIGEQFITRKMLLVK